MGFFDRFLGRTSPRDRHVDRAVDQVTMAFDAATRGRRSQGWRIVSTDSNAENLPALSRLRDVVRDMVRNNPHATRGRKVLTDNIVGAGIIPSAGSRRKTRRKALEDLLKAHFDTTACDARGQTNLYGLQAQVMNSISEAGEALVRWRPRRLSDGLPLPFQLEALEPDHLDTSKDGKLPNGNLAIQGVEFDGIGRRVAYWLFPQHPGSYSNIGLAQSKRIPADQVAHVYRIDRPGQVRGVTWFAPVVLKMRDLADYADAQLLRQKIAACFAAFIQSDDDVAIAADGTTPREDTGGTYPVESLEPGMVQRLKQGESVTFGTPPSVGDYEAYKRAELRDIAVGLGISYEALTGDLTGVNFSSGRMGWLEFQRTITASQNFMLLPMLCEPLGRWFLDAAAQILGPDDRDSVDWTPPRRDMINPKEEIAASRDAIRAGLSSRSLEQRKLGLDPDDLDQENAADQARADKLGLVFDSDPRQRTAQGNAVTGAAAPAPTNPDTTGDPNNDA